MWKPTFLAVLPFPSLLDLSGSIFYTHFDSSRRKRREPFSRAHLREAVFLCQTGLAAKGGGTLSNRHLFTSESVTEGHPDKLCDQVSDAILDAILAQDTQARVACEALATNGTLFVAGEINTECYVDLPRIVRRTIAEVGYTRAKYGFDAETCAVLTAINQQSPDIAQGVNRPLEKRIHSHVEEDELGAGDQGMMFGYACTETPELMPLPITLAHRLTRRLAAVRKDKTLSYLRPDGKSQVTVAYEGDQPVHIEAVVLSAQHDPTVSLAQLQTELEETVIRPVLPEALFDHHTRLLVNPTGRFVIGGPMADTGLTGRKIIVDTYGGYARHGGGAFSGKDPTKVDRSASYAARWVAKNLVAAQLCTRCEVQLAYAIGVAEPVSIRVDTFGTGVLPDDRLAALVEETFDLRPRAIIRELNLIRPIYRQVAAYGHFGRQDLDLPWEATDRAQTLQRAARSV